jgi:hypothetical protein
MKHFYAIQWWNVRFALTYNNGKTRLACDVYRFASKEKREQWCNKAINLLEYTDYKTVKPSMARSSARIFGNKPNWHTVEQGVEILIF